MAMSDEERVALQIETQGKQYAEYIRLVDLQAKTLRARIHDLEIRFKHVHYPHGPLGNDVCALCGLSPVDPIHIQKQLGNLGPLV